MGRSTWKFVGVLALLFLGVGVGFALSEVVPANVVENTANAESERPEVGPDVVAIVDGEPIPMKDLRDQVSGQLADYWDRHDASVYRLRKQALDEIINSKNASDTEIFLKSPYDRKDVPPDDSERGFGPEDAPVQVVVYQDYQCPYCSRHEGSLRTLRGKYGDQLRVEYRDFPLPMHDQATLAGIAARCAAKMGQFENFHNQLFQNAKSLSEAAVMNIAADLGLNESEFSSCLEDPAVRNAVSQEQKEGSGLGVQGTPGTFVNGIPVSGAVPLQTLTSMIESELASDTAPVSDERADEMLSKGIAAEIDGEAISIEQVDEQAGAELDQQKNAFQARIRPALEQFLKLLIYEKIAKDHEIEVLL